MRTAEALTGALRELRLAGRRRRKVDALGLEARIREHQARVARDEPPKEKPKGRPRIYWCANCGGPAGIKSMHYSGPFKIYRVGCEAGCGWTRKIVRRTTR